MRLEKNTMSAVIIDNGIGREKAGEMRHLFKPQDHNHSE